MDFFGKKTKGLRLFSIRHSAIQLLIFDFKSQRLTIRSTPSLGLKKAKITHPIHFANSLDLLAKNYPRSLANFKTHVLLPGLLTRSQMISLEHSNRILTRKGEYQKLATMALDAATTDLEESIDVLKAAGNLENAALSSQNSTQNIKIQSHFSVFTYPRVPLADVISSFNRVGIKVDHLESVPQALSEVVLSLKGKGASSLVIDFESTTTNVLLIHEGFYAGWWVFPIGTNHFAMDLQVGTGMSFEDCLNLVFTRGLDPKNWSDLADDYQRFMLPRIHEWLKRMGDILKNTTQDFYSHVLICGDGSKLPGLSTQMNFILQDENPYLCNLSPSSVRAIFGDIEIDLPEGPLFGDILPALFLMKKLCADFLLVKDEPDSKMGSRVQPFFSWIEDLSK